MRKPDLIASYFTIAGDVFPFGPTEISPFAFEDRVEAAAAAGFSGIGLVYADLMATAERLGYSEMANIVHANGLKHLEFEFLVDWHLDGDARTASDRMRDELLTAAESLGARHVKIAPGLHTTGLDIPCATEAFASVCGDAAKRGVAVVLEIMPFSNVNTLEIGRAIVEGAGASNGGLLIDIWHMSRGGIPFDALAATPRSSIGAIELDDADKYPLMSLWDDTIHRRRLPGEGALDTAGFIAAVQSTGYNGPWGVEVLSETHRKLPLAEMAGRAAQAAERVFK